MKNKKLLITLVLGIIILIITLLYPIIIKSPESEKTPSPSFSEIKIIACAAASQGNACKTKLVDLGIITPEECCNSYGECC